MNSEKPKLKLDWCSHKAAEYACKNWHYSGCIPKSKLVKIGVWENGEFIGVIIYSYGANNMMGKAFGLKQIEICELTRVALREHQTPVSRLLSISQKMLKKLCPGLRLIVSYADIDQEHTGSIYKANGWVYIGKTDVGGKGSFIINGKKVHSKTIWTNYGKGTQNLTWLRENLDPNAEFHVTKGKHKYCMPLDDDMKVFVEKLRKPYPVDMRQQSSSKTTEFHSVKEGVIPILAHQLNKDYVRSS